MATKKKPAKAAKPKRDVGRPSTYLPEYADQARRLCLLGLTDPELASFFGVCERTINYWKGAHPDFLQAITKGKTLADADVAASLYERACGYSHPEDKFFQYEGRIMVEETIKHYPPDTAAAFIWLKNRQSGKWRDKADQTDIDQYVAPVKVEILVKDARKPDAVA